MNTKYLVLAISILLTVVVVSGQRTHDLTLGNPLQSYVAKDGFQYYGIDVDELSEGNTLYFAVTPFSGDPDIYVKLGDEPDEDSYDWASMSSADDFIVIRYDDEKYQSGKTFYVGIHGHEHSVFGLVAYTTEGVIHLPEQSDSILLSVYSRRNEMIYFSYQLHDDSPFKITVTPISGDPDIFVKQGDEKPTDADYHWNSRAFGFDVVSIETSDEHYKKESQYLIGVEAYGEGSMFSFQVNHPNENNQLANGIPAGGYIEENEYVYYEFCLYCFMGGDEHAPEHSLYFELTVPGALESGDPDMFISPGRDSQPTRQSHTWGSRSAGKDEIAIETDDENYRKSGYYTVGVYGHRQSAYQLVVYIEGSSSIIVVDVDHYGTAPKNDYTYLKYRHGDTESDIILHTAVEHGSVEVYVSSKVPQPNEKDDKHEWSAKVEEGEDAVIEIKSEENEEQWYWIGVKGTMTYNDFVMSITTNQIIKELFSGEAILFNRVPTNYDRYFIYRRSSRERMMVITLSPISGDPDLYISNTIERPNPDSCTGNDACWFSTSIYEDTVVIKPDDPRFDYSNANVFHVGAHGHSESLFNILAYESDLSVSLRENQALRGHVEKNEYFYYHFQVPRGSGSVTARIELDVETGADADLYVSCSNEAPNKYHNEYNSINYGDDTIVVKNIAGGKTCYAGVLGSEASSSFNILFSIDDILLDSNAPVMDVVEKGMYRNYTLEVGEYDEVLLVTVTLVDGVTEFYMKNGNEYPTQRNFDLLDFHFPNNAILVTSNDYNWGTGQWSLSVYGVEDSTFYIAKMGTNEGDLNAYAPGITGVIEGAPRAGITSRAYQPIYRGFVETDVTGKAKSDYFIYVDLLVGQADVLVYQDHHHGEFPWNITDIPGDHFMVIPKEELKPGFIHIKIRLPEHGIMREARFTVSMNSADEPTFLTSDIPQNKIVRANEHSYFRVLTPDYKPNSIDPDPRKDLTITVESCLLTEVAPVFYIDGESNINPNADKHESKSEAIDEREFVQYGEVKKTEPNSIHHIGIFGGEYGYDFDIFATAGVNQRPVPGNNGQLEAHYSKKEKTLTVKLYDVGSSTAYPHYYDGYAMEYEGGNDGTEINFNSACVVEHFGSRHGHKEIKYHEKEANNEFEMKLSGLEKNKVYVVNILVEGGYTGANGHNGDGLKSVYVPIWLENGKIVDKLGKGDGYKFQVGWFLIGMGLGIFALYFVGGMIYMYFLGARGIAMIPNVEFWKDLPFLIRDGFMFTITCGRGSFRGSSRYEDLDNQSQYNNEDTNGNVPSSSNTQPTPSGYGAI